MQFWAGAFTVTKCRPTSRTVQGWPMSFCVHGLVTRLPPFECLFCLLWGDDGAEMGGLNFSGCTHHPFVAVTRFVTQPQAPAHRR